MVTWSNETVLAVLLDDTIRFSIFYKMEFRISLEFLVVLRDKGLMDGVQGRVAPLNNNSNTFYLKRVARNSYKTNKLVALYPTEHFML